MKKTFLLFLLSFTYFVSFSQMTDTIRLSENEMNMRILKLEKEVVDLKLHSLEAGTALSKASQNYFYSFGLFLFGGVATTLAFLTKEPTLLVAGGAFYVGGFAFNISAWSEINRSGKSLQRMKIKEMSKGNN